MDGKKFEFILKYSGLSKPEFAELAGISTKTLDRECQSKIVKAVFVALLKKSCTLPEFNDLAKEYERLLQSKQSNKDEEDIDDES